MSSQKSQLDFDSLLEELASGAGGVGELLEKELLLLLCEDFGELGEREIVKCCVVNVQVCPGTAHPAGSGKGTYKRGKNCQGRVWGQEVRAKFCSAERASRREARMGIEISLCSFSKMLPEEEKPLTTSCTGSSQTQNWKGGENCRDSITQLFLGSSWLGAGNVTRSINGLGCWLRCQVGGRLSIWDRNSPSGLTVPAERL